MATENAKAEAARAEAASDLPKISAADLDEARKEGMKAAAKEAAKDTYKYLTDGNLAAAEGSDLKWANSSDIMQYENLLGLDPVAFEKLVSDKGDEALPEEKVAGLLKLERAGQNRTVYVKALCARLGVKSPYEVTPAGPAYTNDQTPVTAL